MTRRAPTSRKPVTLALGSLAVTGVVLAGCGDDLPQEVSFASAEQCVAAGFDRQICEAEYRDALSQHLATAPRFDGRAACEAEYGEGRCLETPRTDGTSGGSFFVPFLTGYLVSSALRNVFDFDGYRSYKRRYPAYVPTPIFTDRTGRTLTSVTDGGTRVARPYNVNTRTAARSGFGGRSFGRSSFGG